MNRRDDLDFAKGIGIILMVLGHSFSGGHGDALKVWFYSFHMPLFFLVSGMIAYLKEERHSIVYTVKHRARGLLLTFFFWCSLIAIYLCVMGRKTLAYFLDLVCDIATFQGLSALWFLPCLYLAEILFAVSRRVHVFNRFLGWGLGGGNRTGWPPRAKRKCDCDGGFSRLYRDVVYLVRMDWCKNLYRSIATLGNVWIALRSAFYLGKNEWQC